MTDARGPILVFGATGRQGGAVARSLLEESWPVRALVRDQQAAARLRDNGADVVTGSFEDSESIRRAMEGAHGVFSVLPGNLPEGDEVRFGCAIANLAAEAGIAHFVYSSGASAGDHPTGVPRFDAKPRIEAHVRALPIATTIVRPVVFMEMLARPGYGLDEGRYTFFLRPEQSMQLVAVEDIGRFAAGVFADLPRFAGRTVRIAGDTVTGQDIETVLGEAAGHPIAYTRFPPEVLAANPDLAHMSESLEAGPLADHVRLDEMRELNPSVKTFRQWLAGPGRVPLAKALGARPPASAIGG